MSREDSFYELLLNIRGCKEFSECLKEFFQVLLYFEFIFLVITNLYHFIVHVSFDYFVTETVTVMQTRL